MHVFVIRTDFGNILARCPEKDIRKAQGAYIQKRKAEGHEESTFVWRQVKLLTAEELRRVVS